MPEQTHGTRKVTAGSIGGAIAAIAAWGLAEFFSLDVPPGIEAALATIIIGALVYFTPEKSNG